MAELRDFDGRKKCDWCPGCGDFGIFAAIKNALVKLGIGQEDVLMVYGIGCHGHMVDFLRAYSFQALHGRTLPVAIGAKLANKKLRIIAVAGDGDCLGEGLNHFVSASRGNYDLTVIITNNQIYGLTTGQTSPTSMKGFKSKSTPAGVIEVPVNPLTIALSSGATFVSRGFAGDIRQLSELIVKAVEHRGFSVVDALQPCVTFNKVNTYQWFRERVYRLEEKGHDPADKMAAFGKALEWEKEDRIPTGIFYIEDKQTYEDSLPQIAEKTLVEQETSAADIKPLIDSMR